MGSSFIITELMLEEKGRKLMLDFYKTIHDDYCLKTFSEFREQRKYWDENAVKEYRNMIKRNSEMEHKLFKSSLSEINTRVELTNDEIKDQIKKEIKKKTIELEFVFVFLSNMDEKLKLDKHLEFECDEDLLCLKKAFLKAYELFYHSGYNLKD